ncbi:MAG TPA: J domain-containing protein [Polyangia bacterium]|nr:J domain-containing protein [Polyangia bacterium]
MTFYEILGLDRRASSRDIERAFRRLARKVHPDLNRGDARGAEARMQKLNEIRDTLTDPARRAAYDARLDRAAAGVAEPEADLGDPGVVPPPETAAPATAPAAEDVTSSRRPRSRAWPLVWLAAGGGVTAVVVALAAHPTKYDLDPLPAAAPAPHPATTAVRPRIGDDPLPKQPVIAPTPATSPVAAAAPTRPPVLPPPVRLRPASARAIVHIGSRADDVLHKLGPPDRVEPGAQAGDATFVYGRLKLVLRNGRVASGAAAE